MKRLIGIIQKEFYHIFRDQRTLLILFGIPIVQITLFGFAISNEIKEVHIGVVDPSIDEQTQAITQKIASTSYFQIAHWSVSNTEVDRWFQDGTVKAVVIFPPRFAEKIEGEGKAPVQIIADATDPNSGIQIANYLQSQINAYLMGLLPPGAMPPAAIDMQVEMRYNPELKSVYMFVPGLITVIMMLISTMLTAIAITREKETGTMEVLLASPIPPAILILGKVIPYLLLAFANALIILMMGRWIFDVPILGSFGLLLAETGLYVLVCLALGILISTVAQTQQVALLMSLFALFMPTMLLSGFIFPVENMPWPLQWVSKIIPATYFNIIIKGIMLKGGGLGLVWRETVTLGGIGLFLLAVGIKRFNIRLE
ncbi:ABC transporter permease [Pontibacter sp. G13]|uniref:ABC transporter permease n=1 Tax=Pontibacter sp. G13 TaxID=3074898 RepID=UPI00288A1306|nr:ABC transporter permease [Pontibacter sp. G13]WNJ19893.1 ABC transporter permease [Pontibacter sp. G13]